MIDPKLEKEIAQLSDQDYERLLSARYDDKGTEEPPISYWLNDDNYYNNVPECDDGTDY